MTFEVLGENMYFTLISFSSLSCDFDLKILRWLKVEIIAIVTFQETDFHILILQKLLKGLILRGTVNPNFI